MSFIVLTGASSGIGSAAAIELTRRGHQVLAVGRTQSKLDSLLSKMQTAAGPDVSPPTPIQCDFSAMNNVRKLADHIRENYNSIDVLVNNAGVQPIKHIVTEDGFELAWAVNHMAPFLLTNLVIDRIQTSGGRVVTTSSSNHKTGEIDFSNLSMDRDYSSANAYDRTKLANILFTGELSRRTQIPATSFHPGTISTDLNRDVRFIRLIKPFERILMSPTYKGADTLTWLATSPEGARPSSHYYYKRTPTPVAEAALDRALANQLWEDSADRLRL